MNAELHALKMDTPVDLLVLMIARRLGIDYDYQLKKWVQVLRDAWVPTVGALLRLSTVGLCEELERVQDLREEKPHPFFALHHGNDLTEFQLHISSVERELVLASFTKLLQVTSPVGITGIQQFQTQFYQTFFTVYPAAQRLFDAGDMITQGRAFVRMLFWIIENVDNSSLSSRLGILGGRHVIYGVDASEFSLFTDCVCETLKVIIGSSEFTQQMEEAWKETLGQLSRLLIRAGEKAKAGIRGELSRWSAKRGSWLRTYISLTLYTLELYRDKQHTKLLASLPLEEISVRYTTKTEMDFLERFHESDVPLPPIPEGVVLTQADVGEVPEGVVLAQADVLPDSSLAPRTVSVDDEEDSNSVDSSASLDGVTAEVREKILIIELSDHAASGIKKSFMLRANVEGVVKSWYDDLKWRVQAHHHIKYDWVSHSSGSEDESSQI